MSTSQWSDPKIFVPNDHAGQGRATLSKEINNFNQTDSLVGRIISNKYKVTELLGQGGMALVYKALLPDGKPVAIKTLKYRQADLETRFGLEIAIHTKLKHLNIVEPIEVLKDPDSELNIFVMEYLEGLNLEDLLAKYKRLNSVEDITVVLSQILDALEYAHYHGIIHRDLKPENIIVVKQAGKNLVKVLDFGLAKIEEDLQKITKTGVVLGSPTYMSPEQCFGTELDYRTDLYSFGILAYELITGTPPYQSNDTMELMNYHCDKLIFPPSMSTTRADIRGIDQLNNVIERVLNTDMEARHTDIYELKEELSDWWRYATNSPDSVDTPFRFITEKISSAGKKANTKEIKSTAALEALVQNKLDSEKQSFREKTEKDSKERFSSNNLSIVKMVFASIIALIVLAGIVIAAMNIEIPTESSKSQRTEIKSNTSTSSLANEEKENKEEKQDKRQDKPKTKSNKRIIAPPGVFPSR